MYAVLVTGGKQYRVMTGETIRVEKLTTEAGQEVKFDQILMLGDGEGVKLGDALKGATVTATVKSHGRADKVRIIKFRRRKHHKKQMGHRHRYRQVPWSRRQGPHHQVPSPQAPQEADGPPSALHRNRNHRHRRW